MAVKVLLLNGPPRSGKDTAADAIEFKLNAVKLKLATPVKDGTHASLALAVRTNHFEECKDTPNPLFLGKTPREAYIAHSEEYMKKVYGPEVFGSLLVNQILTCMEAQGPLFANPLFVISDTGFATEYRTVAKAFGAENVGVLQLSRPGCSFIGDSRHYIEPTNSASWFRQLVNDNDIMDFRIRVVLAARDFYYGSRI